MPFFSYTAVNNEGAVIKGSLEGADIETVRDTVASSGLYVIALKKTGSYGAYIQKLALSRSVSRAEIIEFSKNLSVMLRAGMPLLKGLSDISESHDNRHLRETLNSMRRKIELGSGFSEAASGCANVFPDIFVRLTAVGEETGSLDKSLQEVAEHLEKMEDLYSAIKRALIYPAFAIVATFGALLFWLIYVLPKVMAIFTDLNLKLPLPTRILLFSSDLTRSYWYLLMLAPALVFAGVRILRKRKNTLYYMDSLMIRLPVVKQVTYNMLLALFAEQLRILTAAGITIDRSLKIVSEVINNEVFRRAIEGVREEIAMGGRISDAVGKQKVFPALVKRMVDIGEASGSLEKQFGYLAEYYLKVLEGVSQKIGKMIEPIVIGVIGFMFALIIMGLLLPIYDLVAKIGG